MCLQCSRFSFIDPADIEAIIASEKEVWNREKLSLQKALKRAEAKVYKLKAELRNDALLRNLSPDAEHAALQVGNTVRVCSHVPPADPNRTDRRNVGACSGCAPGIFSVWYSYSIRACSEVLSELEHIPLHCPCCQQCGPTSRSHPLIDNQKSSLSVP